MTTINIIEIPAATPDVMGNLLINPGGSINQRAPATNADNTYGHDRWLALTQTSAIAVSTVTDAENGTPYMWRLTQSQATAQRMGYAQWIEAANCKWLRGQSVTLSGRIKFSLNAAVRYAICEWTGTADTLSTARDAVNNWTSGTFTAGNFFKSTTFNVLAVGSITPAAATLTDLTALTATVGSSCNNLFIMLWTEGTAAQNATLDADLKLEIGSSATARRRRPSSVELALCKQYYVSSYVSGVSPGTVTTAGVIARITEAITSYQSFGVYFSPKMRTTPTIAIYNPATGASGSFRDVSASANISAVSLYESSAYSQIQANGVPVAEGHQIITHYTADAEL